MNQMEQNEIVGVKLDTDLAALVEQALGSPNKSGKWRCPFHDEKTPSFHVYQHDGGWQAYKCFGCGSWGDAIGWVMQFKGLTFKEAVSSLSNGLELSRDDVDRIHQQRKEQNRQAWQDTRVQLEALLPRVARYHAQVKHAMPYWNSQGLDQADVERWQLGYADRCPLENSTDSYVIPGFYNGKLVTVRHRLANPNGKGKYLPEMAGLPAVLFNADVLRDPKSDQWLGFGLLGEAEVIVVEGEVKTMVLDKHGLRTVGLPGVSTWKEEWARLFSGFKKAFIAFDPPTAKNRVQIERHQQRVARDLSEVGLSVFVATLPGCKPDDYLVRFGGDTEGLYRVLVRRARRVTV